MDKNQKIAIGAIATTVLALRAYKLRQMRQRLATIEKTRNQFKSDLDQWIIDQKFNTIIRNL